MKKAKKALLVALTASMCLAVPFAAVACGDGSSSDFTEAQWKALFKMPDNYKAEITQDMSVGDNDASEKQGIVIVKKDGVLGVQEINYENPSDPYVESTKIYKLEDDKVTYTKCTYSSTYGMRKVIVKADDEEGYEDIAEDVESYEEAVIFDFSAYYSKFTYNAKDSTFTAKEDIVFQNETDEEDDWMDPNVKITVVQSATLKKDSKIKVSNKKIESADVNIVNSYKYGDFEESVMNIKCKVKYTYSGVNALTSPQLYDGTYNYVVVAEDTKTVDTTKTAEISNQNITITGFSETPMTAEMDYYGKLEWNIEGVYYEATDIGNDVFKVKYSLYDYETYEQIEQSLYFVKGTTVSDGASSAIDDDLNNTGEIDPRA